MLNVGTGEMILIAVAALLILGPKRLPELARGIGKFMREFRRQTDDVRNVVEREFYKMDQEMEGEPPKLQAAQGAVSNEMLPPPTTENSQLTAGMPDGPLAHDAMHGAEHPPLDESDPAHPDYHRSESAPESSADPVSAAAPTTAPAPAPAADAPVAADSTSPAVPAPSPSHPEKVH